MNHWGVLAIAIISEVIATSALKGSAGFTRVWPSALVVIGYGISFYCLATVLKTLPVGIAYAVWSGAGIVLVTGVAWLVYGQKLDFWAYVGIAFIVIGVLILNLLSKSSAH